MKTITVQLELTAVPVGKSFELEDCPYLEGLFKHGYQAVGGVIQDYLLGLRVVGDVTKEEEPPPPAEEEAPMEEEILPVS